MGFDGEVERDDLTLIIGFTECGNQLLLSGKLRREDYLSDCSRVVGFEGRQGYDCL